MTSDPDIYRTAFVQFVGTPPFNVKAFDALPPGLDGLQEDMLTWTPDPFGSGGIGLLAP
jgi:hypothetical protein